MISKRYHLTNLCITHSHRACVNLILIFQVTRPDGKTESLGLSVLDEPCAKQSDRTVLDLQIRAVSKQTAVKPMVYTKDITFTPLHPNNLSL